MKLKKLGANQTEVLLSDGTRVLFSYETPVAAITHNGVYIQTSKKWSRTTSKHISQWWKANPLYLSINYKYYGLNVQEHPQEVLDNLVKG